MSCSIVILSYNGADFLKKFLPPLLQYSEGYEIVVADNGSADDSVKILETQFPTIRLIQIPNNKGFAGGYNYALAQIEADYFVLLNSDVEVTPQWLQPCLGLLESDKHIWACQPKIRSFHQKQNFEYAGAAGGFLDYLGYAFCRGRIFDTCEADTGQYNQSSEIFWATGACMAVRADKFKELGGFDERYFAHYEEIDLCWRMKRAGGKVYYCPDSVVYHVGGGTLHKSNPHKTFLNFRNSLLTIVKNTAPQKRFFVILCRLILDGISGIKFLIDGNWRDCLAIIKAHFAFYGVLFFESDKTTKINHYSADLYPKSIVWAYFVKGKKYFSSLET